MCALSERTGGSGLDVAGFVFERRALRSRQIDQKLARAKDRNSRDKLIFIKSWNEWAEGNLLEPNRTTSTQYLETIKARLASRLV